MFFCYLWGLEFLPRLETQCGGWPSLLKEREIAIVVRFRKQGGIWSCVGRQCCVIVQKRNRRAGGETSLIFCLIVFILNIVYLHVFFLFCITIFFLS